MPNLVTDQCRPYVSVTEDAPVRCLVTHALKAERGVRAGNLTGNGHILRIAVCPVSGEGPGTLLQFGWSSLGHSGGNSMVNFHFNREVYFLPAWRDRSKGNMNCRIITCRWD